MNKKEIAFFAGCIILGMVISVILSKTSISDKTHEFKCVRIQDYEGGDYSPEHYYMKDSMAVVYIQKIDSRILKIIRYDNTK